MRLLLKVPQEDTDKAQKFGVMYDNEIKCWYAEQLKYGSLYSEYGWLSVEDVNLYCESLYLFQVDRKCWKCGKATPCICLGTDKSYSVQENFATNNNLQLLSLLKDVPHRLKRYLDINYKCFESYSKQQNDTYIANHCIHCGALQGDYFLHQLPETSFYQCLCYRDGLSPVYKKIVNNYLVPVSAHLPNYDIVSHSIDALMLHMETEVENWASLNIDQKLVNKLLGVSEKKEDITL